MENQIKSGSIVAKSETLIFAVAKLKKAMPKGQSIIPIIQFIRLDKSGLTTTDIETMVTVHIPGIPEDISPALIPFAELEKALKVCKGAEVEIIPGDGSVQIKSGSRVFKFANEPADDFPTVSDHPGNEVFFTAEDCRRIFKAYTFCGNDPLRPNMSGVFIGAGEVCGTDAHKLYAGSISPVTGSYPDENGGYILPAAFAKVFAMADLKCGIRADFQPESGRAYFDTSAHLKNGDTLKIRASFRLIPEKYPNYKQVIPETEKKQAALTFNRAKILESVAAAQVCANESTKQIRFDFAESVRLSSQDLDLEREFSEELTAGVTYFGDCNSGRIAFNSVFFADVANLTDSADFGLEFHNENRAAIIREPGQIYLLMPVMIID